MDHSFFSVIVPVCRCGKYAECLVKSLLRQSFGDFEVLILGDGSGDGTLDAYRRQAGGEKRFRFFELEHGGTASRLRNAGIRPAQGRYLIFLDRVAGAAAGNDVCPDLFFPLCLLSAVAAPWWKGVR